MNINRRGEKKKRRNKKWSSSSAIFCFFVLRDSSVEFSPCSFSNNILWSPWTPRGRIAFFILIHGCVQIRTWISSSADGADCQTAVSWTLVVHWLKFCRASWFSWTEIIENPQPRWWSSSVSDSTDSESGSSPAKAIQIRKTALICKAYCLL